MKSPYACDLPLNQPVTATFLVHSKEVRQKKSGEPYLSLVLGDKSGDLDAKMWENVAETMDTFGRDDFVRVKGLLNIYQNRPQFTVHKVQRVSESEVDPADFFPVSARDPEEMFEELRGVVAGIGNPHLRALLEALFGDEEIARRYRKAPAAKSVHHAYLGGLLEHVLSLCALCRFAGSHYKGLDLDLLLTGALLHDIGKVYELDYQRSISYTTDGQLLGHILMGVRMVEEKLRGLPEFPPKLRVLIEHMILSHHGELEFGSPKQPLFAEAVLLHHLDNLDAKMECARSLTEKDRLVEGEWTSYCAPLDRSLLKKSRYLEEKGEPAAGPAAAPPSVAAARTQKRPSDFGEKLRSALGGDGTPEEG